MVSKVYKQKAHKLVQEAKEKGLVTKYKEFSKTELAKKTSLKEDEVAYYISKQKGGIKWSNTILEI